jgi:hypothetical protein
MLDFPSGKVSTGNEKVPRFRNGCEQNSCGSELGGAFLSISIRVEINQKHEEETFETMCSIENIPRLMHLKLLG